MRKILFVLFFLGVCMYPVRGHAALSDLSITEIMYDADGSDTDREWIEIRNAGSDPVTIPTGTGDQSLRLYEEHGSTKHNHTLADPYQGSATIPAGGFAIIAQDGVVFKSAFPSYAGTIFVASAMSLSNTAQTIGLKIGSAGSVWSSISYANTWGANGDGKSLQIQGGQWSAVAPTPGSEGQLGAANGSGAEETPQAPAEGPKSLGTVLSEPKFKADAGGDRKVFVGAPVFFEGRVFGYKDREIDGGRFLWSFGDGASREGRSVQHVYRFPGTYVASVSVSSDRESVADYARITVVPNSIFISEIAGGNNGFIEFTNAANEEISLDSWIIKNERTIAMITFPSNMMIGKRAAIAVPVGDSKILEGLTRGDSLILAYSNNTPATRVILSEPLEEGRSISFDQSGNAHKSLIPTPGSLEKGEATASVAARNVMPETKFGIAATSVNPKLSNSGAKQDVPSEAPARTEEFAAAAFSGSSGWLWVSVGISALGVAGFFFVRNILL